MKKFQVGDRVIDLDSIENGVGIVVRLDDRQNWLVAIRFPDSPHWTKNHDILYDEIDCKHLIPEHVFNSPLYKALK